MLERHAATNWRPSTAASKSLYKTRANDPGRDWGWCDGGHLQRVRGLHPRSNTNQKARSNSAFGLPCSRCPHPWDQRADMCVWERERDGGKHGTTSESLILLLWSPAGIRLSASAYAWSQPGSRPRPRLQQPSSSALVVGSDLSSLSSPPPDLPIRLPLPLLALMRRWWRHWPLYSDRGKREEVETALGEKQSLTATRAHLSPAVAAAAYSLLHLRRQVVRSANVVDVALRADLTAKDHPDVKSNG